MALTTSEKVRDQHARRRLERLGYSLMKARPNGRWTDDGPYGIVGSDRQWIVPHTMRIDEVEAWLDGAEQAKEVPLATS